MAIQKIQSEDCSVASLFQSFYAVPDYQREYPRIRIVRFREPYLTNGIEVHRIGEAEVRVYSIAKTIADAFRNPKLLDRSVTIEAMKAALSARKATAGQLATAARGNGAWSQMRPYLEALASSG